MANPLQPLNQYVPSTINYNDQSDPQKVSSAIKDVYAQYTNESLPNDLLSQDFSALTNTNNPKDFADKWWRFASDFNSSLTGQGVPTVPASELNEYEQLANQIWSHLTTVQVPGQGIGKTGLADSVLDPNNAYDAKVINSLTHDVNDTKLKNWQIVRTQDGHYIAYDPRWYAGESGANPLIQIYDAQGNQQIDEGNFYHGTADTFVLGDGTRIDKTKRGTVNVMSGNQSVTMFGDGPMTPVGPVSVDDYTSTLRTAQQECAHVYLIGQIQVSTTPPQTETGPIEYLGIDPQTHAPIYKPADKGLDKAQFTLENESFRSKNPVDPTPGAGLAVVPPLPGDSDPTGGLIATGVP